MRLDYNISEIPIEFIQSNLSNYQKDNIEMKYHILKKFEKLQAKGIKKIDAYQLISEDVFVSWERVQAILLSIK